MDEVLRFVREGARSTRYSRLRRFKERGVLEDVGGEVVVNYFSPYTWRLIYGGGDPERVIFRAINASGGVLTGMRVVGLVAPNPYSDVGIYEVYVPRERADVFAAVVGLGEDVVVFRDPRSLFSASPSGTAVLAYELGGYVESERVGTLYGFSIDEATLEQAMVDVIRNDYWYRRGAAFEVYFYAREYLSPGRTFSLAKQVGVERRLLTIDYVVSETVGVEPLFDSLRDAELDTLPNLPEIVARLGDVVD
ncbi:MAG: hypothetical protein J7L55_03110 [Desulfurococcales archaeon]|nr:hypothetical protein [Desulfurococcales archaeon]